MDIWVWLQPEPSCVSILEEVRGCPVPYLELLPMCTVCVWSEVPGALQIWELGPSGAPGARQINVTPILP